MIRHVAGLAEIVDDVPAAVAFYRDVLGLTVEKELGEDYVMLTLPGVLHFGIWARAHAAECLHGSRDAAERVPLGFHLELEVDGVREVTARLEAGGLAPIHGARSEAWGQTTCRLASPSGSLLGLAETPWARRLTTAPEAVGNEAAPEEDG